MKLSGGFLDLAMTSSIQEVLNLVVNLENGQRVYFNQDTAHNLAQIPPETNLSRECFCAISHVYIGSNQLYVDLAKIWI